MKNTVLIGLKPNLTQGNRITESMALILKSLEGSMVEEIGLMPVNETFVAELYQGNQYQQECIATYSGHSFYFLVATTNKNFAEIEAIKKDLRTDLLPFAAHTNAIGDNSIHISDADASAQREINFVMSVKYGTSHRSSALIINTKKRLVKNYLAFYNR